MDLRNKLIIFLYGILVFLYNLFLMEILYYKLLCSFNKCSPLSGYEPKYNPRIWNDNINIKYSHNCYAYALNDINIELKKICENVNCKSVNPQPGHFGNNIFKFPTCYQIRNSIFADNPNIIKTKFEIKCPKHYYKIGFGTNLNSYYHFYRQNSYGLWDHKDGGRKTSLYDASNKLIFNPMLADRNYDIIRNYDLWCGFLCIPTNKYLKTNMSRIINNELIY